MPPARLMATIVLAATSLVVVATCLTGQLPPPAEDVPELRIVTGEVVEVDVENGVIVVHVEAVDELEAEHFDLEVWIDEETLFENESDWTIRSASDLLGTLVDVEGFLDTDAFVADVIRLIEGPVEDETPTALT